MFSPKLIYWLYRGTFFILIVFCVGFSSVMPIDAIVRATGSENNALNTFIVIGALVVFALVCVILMAGRILFHNSCLIDVPRRYLPITSADLPHEPSRKLILNNMERSKELSILFKKPKHHIIHPGLEPPVSCDIPGVDKLFPEYLNYGNCIKFITSRLKYNGVFLAISGLPFDLEDTFSDILYKHFIENNLNKTQVVKAKRFIEIYEQYRFGRGEITRKEFIEFVEHCIYFSDLIMNSESYTTNANTRMNSARRGDNIASQNGYTDSTASSNSRMREYPDLDYATDESSSIKPYDGSSERDLPLKPTISKPSSFMGLPRKRIRTASIAKHLAPSSTSSVSSSSVSTSSSSSAPLDNTSQ
ncbi:hypothetical protein KAFR_0A00420 [Kazachstania africana CBS 2517]|uniref:Defect at low temperature protein 1 n=1 Tax=Kazachstania africana (strain ATCC 22294 / BCRC 22015 / CBS 2517 / CECT 1963 / NBRC 1671 / NRRL Y-8276) TaxID=1071382 RepID=H2AM80_KAZAF|nr:hypothetical protein KAFR_0A00420 [Kazachstania africana CBS 2517]CCF55480.1 hypothetical protein KAFR_0A00420 [Kazachstania africana CBS 2517]